MTDRLNNNLAKIFACLSNSKRRQIIFATNDTSNEIFADPLQNNLIIKELKNMEDLGLVKQEQIGMYSLTTVGSAVAECSKGFEFLEKNKDFFADHGFGDVPKSLLKNIGRLANSQFYYGVHLALSKWSKIVSESQEFVNCIFSQPPIVVADYLGPKIQGGLKVQTIFDKSSKIPDCNEFVNKLGLREHKTNENFKKRIAENIKINIIMSEKEACVIFPDNNGVVDMMENFISSDPDFISWCKEFFEYKWNNSEPIARLR
jgi:predicted transcriptional regulator